MTDIQKQLAQEGCAPLTDEQLDDLIGDEARALIDYVCEPGTAGEHMKRLIRGVARAAINGTYGGVTDKYRKDARRYRLLRQENIDSYNFVGSLEALDAQLDAFLKKVDTLI